MITGLLITPYRERHIALHDVSRSEVEQVLALGPVFALNHNGRVGSLFMIGPTTGGRMLTVVIESTTIAGVWFVRTAFDASNAQRVRYHSDS